MIFRFFGLSAFWGFVLGVGLGLVVGGVWGLMSLSLGGILYSVLLMLAAFIIPGVLLGGIGGGILGVITLIFVSRMTDSKRYKILAGIVMAATMFVGAFFSYSSILTFYSVTGRVELWVILVPTVLQTLASIYASQCIAKWYLKWHEYNYVESISAS